MSFLRTLLVFALGLGASAQAASNTEIISNLSRNVILATYMDLAEKTEELKSAVLHLQAKPSERNMKAAQIAWREARIPWERSEAFIFGPVDALGIDPLLDSWPLNTDDIESILNSGRSITTDFIMDLGADVQGFHTVEYLLFGNGIQSNEKSVKELSIKEREYLAAAATLLHRHAADLAYAWSYNYDPEKPKAPGYVEVISSPSAENPFYTSERAVMEEFVQGMMGIIDEVANVKMGEALGEDIESADLSLLESPYSWNSLDDFKNNIRSVQNIYTGRYENHFGVGIKHFVGNFDSALSKNIEANIKECIELMEAIRPESGDMGAALKDPAGREKVQQAIDALNELNAVLEEQVLPLLDL